MGGSALSTIKEQGSDYPFDSTRSIIESADFAMANLEAPFTNSGTQFDKTFTFRVPPRFSLGVHRAGFDVLGLANNHILDYGTEGLVSTMNLLDSLGIAFCGAGTNSQNASQGIVLQKGKWRVGFLAYSLTYPSEFWASSSRAGTAFPNHFKENIQEINENTDLVIVAFHWGGELKTHPKLYQRQYAHQAIDSGADLVIGHHPHILQGLELYQGRLIAYSLGNFVFGSYSRNARDSMMLRVRYDNLGFLLAEIIPISVFNLDVQFQPRLLSEQDRERVIVQLNDISSTLNSGKDILRASGLIIPEK